MPDYRISAYRVPRAGSNALQVLNSYVEASRIEARLRGLVGLRVSQLTVCPEGTELYSQLALEAGASSKDIRDLVIWRRSSRFDEREMAVFAWTDVVTQASNGFTTDAVLEHVRKYLSDEELFDLTLVIATAKMFCELALAVRFPEELKFAGSVN